MTQYVVRVPGYTYRDGREERHLCYLTRDGMISINKLDARIYDTAADAWFHLMTALSYNDEGFVEEFNGEDP